MHAQGSRAAEGVYNGGVSGRWIEEGLFYAGPTPPVGVGRPADWVELPHESYLPIPKSLLDAALREHPRARAAGVAFDHLLRMADGLVHYHHHETLNLLKLDYLLFAPDEGAALRAKLADEELIARERRFLGNFLRATVLGNFTPMSDADHRRAMEQTYLLDVPVEVDWRRHDGAMLDDFLRWADSDEGRTLRDELGVEGKLRDELALPEELGTRALVLWRGLDRDRAEGRFLLQRLDLLLIGIIRAVTWPVAWPIQRLIDRRKRREPVVPASVPDEAGSIFERRWLRRRNLRNQGLFHRLFRVVRLQEPMFRQLILLFRLRDDPTIHLKMFRNIPLSDAEIVFPDKKIRMSSFDVAMLIIGGATVVPALYDVIAHGAGASLALLLGVGAVVAKTVGRYLHVRSKYLVRVTQHLYEKNIDNSLGVLQYLVDSLEEQEYKEAIVVYFILWTEDRPLGRDELDGAVERWLAARFGDVEVDFEIDDALRKVTGDGLLPIVEVDPVGRYRARPLRDALRILDERWDDLLRYNEHVGSTSSDGSAARARES